MSSLKNLFTRMGQVLLASVHRNDTIIKAVSLTFVGVILAAIVLTAVVFSVSPEAFEWVQSLVQSENIPQPYTETLFAYILQNNVGHFWNPIRMLVWVPLAGTFMLGVELVLNGILIGSVATTVGLLRGVAYPIVGLVPHGILEIPAFILEFGALLRWHVTVVEAVMVRITSKEADGAKVRQGIKDTVVLAVASIGLFVIAALVETYITPRLLGL